MRQKYNSKKLGKFKRQDKTNDRVALSREYKRGKYYCTIDLLFDWFGLVCFAN
jgi:hypothetical protein